MALAVNEPAVATRGGRGKTRLLVALAMVLAIGAAAAGWSLLARAQETATAAADTGATGRATESEGRRLQLTSDGQVKSIALQDENGRSPTELVHTPQGVVTIQRTFSDAGVLLKEEAFLDGQPVPLPAR